MSDSWLTLYEQANQASTDISALISEKISLDASKSSTAKVKAQLRKKLEQLKSNHKELVEKLTAIEKSGSSGIGHAEINRRMNLNLQLANQIDRCEEALDMRKKNDLRDELGMKKVKGKAEETEQTSGMNNQMLYDDHKSKIEKNNKDLDMIHDGVVRIKHIAIGMNDELDLQTKLLDETEDTMDRVNDKVKQNTQLTKKVGEKARAGFGFWIILILLIVILV